MATGVDQAAGMSLVVFSLVLFTYYSVWVIILPFVDSDHFLHKYFLPREYSVILPGIAAVILLICIGQSTMRTAGQVICLSNSMNTNACYPLCRSLHRCHHVEESQAKKSGLML
uniref:Dolichol phosphate-mannose biosynthesis regulatory protein n=2 Tax=Haplochromini TaxID=319058 RepID=A0A3Q2WQX4_HAPBU